MAPPYTTTSASNATPSTTTILRTYTYYLYAILKQKLLHFYSFGLVRTQTAGKVRKRKTRKQKKKTLVLDLDETLVHSTTTGYPGYHTAVEVNIQEFCCIYFVYKRPHLDYFLKEVSRWYNLVVFTASLPDYADAVIDRIDPRGDTFTERYFRSDCIYEKGQYIKDLKVLKVDMSSICLVDNSAISYARHQANGIPIDAWIRDPNDTCLLDLLPMLEPLSIVEDVRSILAIRTMS